MQVPLKQGHLSAKLHGVTTLENVFLISTDVENFKISIDDFGDYLSAVT
jgi:hypothetical protein